MFDARKCLAAVCAIWFGAATAQASANTYPERPVRLIVPFPAGSSIDTAARVLARNLTPALGQAIVVENKAGAGGTVGAVAAAHAAPDGYTIFLGSVAQLIGKVAQPSVAFDPLKDFAPVSLTYRSAAIVTVSTQAPVQSVADLVRWAKANPGALNYYSGGVGTAAHLLGATLSTKEDVKTVHIPLRAVTDMLPQLGDKTPHFACFIAPAVRPYVESRRLRALAVSSRERLPQLPDVPTLYEVFKDEDFVQESWLGIWAPAGTPKPVMQKLFTATERAVNSADFRDAMRRQDQQAIASSSPEAFASYMRAEYAKWERLANVAQLPRQ
ncbi:Bug family tripartite tricarboxylate transporter substrate binding protein [Cupriavidus lacunae]|nr:tripartite tricarboxylate transporter substrate binding protein [Cupriavidus lacunae]